MAEKAQRPKSRFRRFAICSIRVIYLIVLLAIIDALAAHFRGNTLFSIRLWTVRDGGTRFYVGPGYNMLFWSEMSGERHGPEVWFWFTPFKISLASKEPAVKLVWRD